MTGPDLSLDLLATLRDRLAGHVPPPFPAPQRSSAVLLLLAHLEGALHLLLERRTTGPSPFSAHLSFPGGRIEPADPDSWSAAVREAWEEIRAPPHMVRRIGFLGHVVNHLGHRVDAHVGLLAPGCLPALDPHPAEVAELLAVPLDALMSAPCRSAGSPARVPLGLGHAEPGPGVHPYQARTYERRQLRGGPLLHYWALAGESGGQATLWGLSGDLTARLLDHLGWTPPGSPIDSEGWDSLQP